MLYRGRFVSVRIRLAMCGACYTAFLTMRDRWSVREGAAMELKLASAMGRLGTETAFEVLAKAKALEAQGRSVIHLEIGEPDFDTPAHIVEAAKRALDEGYTHYGPAAGLPELREAIAQEISTSRGVG